MSRMILKVILIRNLILLDSSPSILSNNVHTFAPHVLYGAPSRNGRDSSLAANSFS
jgi:hypothetical protein